VKASRIDRVKSMMKVLDQVWALPFSYLAMRKIGVKKLDPEQISEGMRRLNESLRNDRTKMRSQKMIRLCDLLIELNEVGIQMNDTYVKERELSAQCLKLKKEAVAEQKLEKARLFVECAEQLYNARNDSIAVMKRKNQKQEEVARMRDEFRVLKDEDVRDLIGTALVDAVTSMDLGKPTGYATAAKLGDISARYLVRGLEKTSMSTKPLNRAIRLRQRCQERYLTWRGNPVIRALLVGV